jgi:Fe-S cluster assembly protein SufD
MNASLRRQKSEAESALMSAFESLGPQLPGQERVRALRADAAALFGTQGLPTRRVEAWHYSDLRAQMKDALPLATRPDASALARVRAILPPVQEGQVRTVLVDGYLAEELSAGLVTSDITMRTLDEVLESGDKTSLDILCAETLDRGDAALALNTAFMRGGVEIAVEPHYEAALPIEIYCVTLADQPKAIFTRSVVRAGYGSKLTVVERHITLGDARVQKNDALVLFASGRSQVEHLFHRPRMRDDELHVHSVMAIVWEHVKLNSVALVEGGGFLRRQIFGRFEAEGAELSLAGATLLRGRDHADTTLVVDHANAGNVSREYFKHIVDDAATGVFQGKVVVAPHAQKTDGVMKSQTILLGEDAAMYNKPELEIFADDVTCGHGATVGALDPAQVFYAMSRGIPREDAEAMLLEAFAGDAIEGLSDESLREVVMENVRNWLGGRRA